MNDKKQEKTEASELETELSDEMIGELLALSGMFDDDIGDKEIPKLSEERLEELLTQVKNDFPKSEK